MRMRLAFSVAAHLEPEILLVDEVLAVGDVAFQRKSLEKMGDVVGDGRTVLFISHNLAAVRALCQSAIYLQHGRIAYAGDVNAAIEKYTNQDGTRQRARPQLEPDPARPTQILSAVVENPEGRPATDIPHDQPFWVWLKLAIRRPLYTVYVALHILDAEMETILTLRDVDQGESSIASQPPGTYAYRVRLQAPHLVPGKYWLSVEIRLHASWARDIVDRAEGIWPFEVYDNGSALSRMNLSWSGKFSLPVQWQCVERTLPGEGGLQS
jgi:lipopolysaccharide transport system ATP-binding protein